LNGQLIERGSRLARTCRTSAEYRLFELAHSTPRKPGLVHEPGFTGPGIEVEVWNMPVERFGSFVSLIPAPLGIGKVTLEDGSQVCGFICEPRGVAGAREITSYGGWRKWLGA
jgi:allophanate hydrolase